MTKSPTVLVTGASGFIAIHCIIQLLEQGYNVRGTLRKIIRENELRQTLAKFVDAADRLQFVQANLLDDNGWDEATQGCDYVLHLASPFPMFMPKDENDLIRPAREGTLRVFKAAANNGVKRLVLTSSTAAVAYGHPKEKRVFDESDWSIVESPGKDPYQKSKTLAERAAWDFMERLPENHPMDMVVINPGYVLGPLPDTSPRTFGVLVYKFAQRQPARCSADVFQLCRCARCCSRPPGSDDNTRSRRTTFPVCRRIILDARCSACAQGTFRRAWI